MKKKELIERVDACMAQTREALQTVYDSLNQGQKQKLLKNEAVSRLLARYGVQM